MSEYTPPKRSGVILYWETFDLLEKMADGQAKEMLRAIRLYAQYNKEPDFSNEPALDMAWTILKQRVDADGERYANRCLQNQQNAITRWHGKKHE